MWRETHDWDVTETKRDDTTSKNIDDIGTSIPERECKQPDDIKYTLRAHIRSIFVNTPIVRVPGKG